MVVSTNIINYHQLISSTDLEHKIPWFFMFSISNGHELQWNPQNHKNGHQSRKFNWSKELGLKCSKFQSAGESHMIIIIIIFPKFLKETKLIQSTHHTTAPARAFSWARARAASCSIKTMISLASSSMPCCATFIFNGSRISDSNLRRWRPTGWSMDKHIKSYKHVWGWRKSVIKTY